MNRLALSINGLKLYGISAVSSGFIHIIRTFPTNWGILLIDDSSVLRSICPPPGVIDGLMVKNSLFYQE